MRRNRATKLPKQSTSPGLNHLGRDLNFFIPFNFGGISHGTT